MPLTNAERQYGLLLSEHLALQGEVARLRAVEAAALLLAREDVTVPGLREDTITCVFCDGPDLWLSATGHTPQPLQHAADCPYVALWRALGHDVAAPRAGAGRGGGAKEEEGTDGTERQDRPVRRDRAAGRAG